MAGQLGSEEGGRRLPRGAGCGSAGPVSSAEAQEEAQWRLGPSSAEEQAVGELGSSERGGVRRCSGRRCGTSGNRGWEEIAKRRASATLPSDGSSLANRIPNTAL